MKPIELRALGVLLALTCGLASWGQSDSSSPPVASPGANPAVFAPDVVTVPPGERVLLELQDSLHTRQTQTGDSAHFRTVQEVLVNSQIAIPRGSSVRATVTSARRPGRVKGRAEIRLRFDEIVLPDGTTMPFGANVLRAGFIQFGGGSSEPQLKGEGSKARDVGIVATGAGQGALFGAIFGGQKGAAYGGAVGAGIGLLSVLFERGPDLDLPQGTLFEVELVRGLEIPLASMQRFSQVAQSAPASFPSSQPAAGDFQFPEPSSEESSTDIPADLRGENTEIATRGEGDDGPAAAEPATTTPPVPGAPAPAEGPTVPDPTLGDPEGYRMKVDVRLVLVDAFVRDVRGRPLDQLKREDFRLFEDGVEQKIRHFSRDELPLAVALVVDRSGSVLPYMPELRRAAYDTLRQLKPGDRVALFAFAEDVERLENLTTDRRRIAERVASIRAGGGTNITDAIFLAAQYLSLAARDQRRIIILISDNQATVRGHASQSDTIRTALEGEVTVYSIKTPGLPSRGQVFGFPVPMPTFGGGSVRKIAEETGGEIIDVERVGSLSVALETVVTRLKTRYTLGYQSTNKAANGAFRHVEVRLADRFGQPSSDYQVYAKRGYYAPVEQVASQAPAPTGP